MIYRKVACFAVIVLMSARCFATSTVFLNYDIHFTNCQIPTKATLTGGWFSTGHCSISESRAVDIGTGRCIDQTHAHGANVINQFCVCYQSLVTEDSRTCDTCVSGGTCTNPSPGFFSTQVCSLGGSAPVASKTNPNPKGGINEKLNSNTFRAIADSLSPSPNNPSCRRIP